MSHQELPAQMHPRYDEFMESIRDITLRKTPANLEFGFYVWLKIVDKKIGKFALGDRVKKKSGSEWQGYIVGWYSTGLTKTGYAVESESHLGSVQIYPESALELVL